jgi:hypothetical protein
VSGTLSNHGASGIVVPDSSLRALNVTVILCEFGAGAMLLWNRKQILVLSRVAVEAFARRLTLTFS